jgi:hypothetical protein
MLTYIIFLFHTPVIHYNTTKSDLRKFVYDKRNVSRKRKFLVQKGGFLPLLIPAAIDTVARLVSFAVDKFSGGK